jgi:hypothetical protein
MKRILQLTWLFLLPLIIDAQIAPDKTVLNTNLFEGFPTGSVLMKNGTIEYAPLNYNTLDQTIVFKKGEQIMTLIEPATVDTVYILDRKFIFIKKGFFEVTAGTPETALCLSYKGKLKPIVATANHDGTIRKVDDVSNTVSNTYVNRSGGVGSNYAVSFSKNLWVKVYNEIYRADNQKQFLKAIPSHLSDKAAAYIKENKTNFKDEKDVAALVVYCNQAK